MAILLALMLSVISFLTAPEYFEYTPDLVTVAETEVGEVTLSFSNKVTNYMIQQIDDPDERNTVYHWKHGLRHGIKCSRNPVRGL